VNLTRGGRFFSHPKSANCFSERMESGSSEKTLVDGSRKKSRRRKKKNPLGILSKATGRKRCGRSFILHKESVPPREKKRESVQIIGERGYLLQKKKLSSGEKGHPKGTITLNGRDRKTARVETVAPELMSTEKERNNH